MWQAFLIYQTIIRVLRIIKLIIQMSVDFEYDSDESVLSDNYSSDSDTDKNPMNYTPTWVDDLGTMKIVFIQFEGENKLLVTKPGENRPIDWFNLLVDDVFLEQIVRETDNYVEILFCLPGTTAQL